MGKQILHQTWTEAEDTTFMQNCLKKWFIDKWCCHTTRFNIMLIESSVYKNTYPWKLQTCKWEASLCVVCWLETLFTTMIYCKLVCAPYWFGWEEAGSPFFDEQHLSYHAYLYLLVLTSFLQRSVVLDHLMAPSLQKLSSDYLWKFMSELPPSLLDNTLLKNMSGFSLPVLLLLLPSSYFHPLSSSLVEHYACFWVYVGQSSL